MSLNQVGYTALMGATMNGSAELIQLLVDKGATLDLKNNVSFNILKLCLCIAPVQQLITKFVFEFTSRREK